jgi:NAD+ synthase (glutamine-hydrolysing)
METAPFGFLRVGAAAPRLRVADPEFNASAVLESFGKAQAAGVQVLVFPELTLTGYTAGDLFMSLSTLVGGAERALERLLRKTASSPMVLAVGLPVVQDGRLFNTAALLQGGRLLGVVPKSYTPSYREFYEERWFATAREVLRPEIFLAGERVPFGTDLLFSIEAEAGVCLAVEICEDLFVPLPPSSRHAVNGATVLLNLSASPEAVGKAEYRRSLVTQHSASTISAYVYAGSGVHESTTDVVFGGHLLVAENGILLAEAPRFEREGGLLIVEADTERLVVERARQNSFGDCADGGAYRRVLLQEIPAARPLALLRKVDPHPFVPGDPKDRDERCQEVFSIQTAGLAKRLSHTGIRKVVLGLSGGLDSTLALLVACRTFDLLELPRRGILGITLPGPGTTTMTRESAGRLAGAVGISFREIDIREACLRHAQDIGLDPKDASSTTYQNLQARERTQVLMDLANLEGGLVVGTGDLSELALGFCTYGGDHMSMYNVNVGVPKTLVRSLVEWVLAHEETGPRQEVLKVVLTTPVSPELLPPGADGTIVQRTEDVIGPYELHDFFLWALLRLGAGPQKTLFLASHAFEKAYSGEEVRRWLRVFLDRFFDSQFKRSASPDGPKVGSVSLSPRGDWRMPSDASKAAWLDELERGADVVAGRVRTRTGGAR